MKREIIDASQFELEDNVVSIKRVTKVVKGGRNFRFTALVVVGDGNGHVGAGLGKFGSAEVLMKKSPEGTGIIAGGPARAVLDLAGYKNIRTKSLGSRNKQNVVLATIAGLSELKTPEEVAKLRGLSVEEVLG